MNLIGDKQRLAMEIAPADTTHPAMRVVNIYVAGINISEFDNTVYVPQFRTSLSRAADALKHRIDYARFEPTFFELSLEEAHRMMVEEQGEVFSACRVLDFGATTDQSLSFLIPHRGRLYLTSQMLDAEEDAPAPVHITPITAYEMIRVMEQAAEALHEPPTP